MKKSEEIKNPESYLNRAKDDETLFVLLGRDPIAWKMVSEWIANRIIHGLNKIDDPQIIEAQALMQAMKSSAYSRYHPVFLHCYWEAIQEGAKIELPGWYFWGENEVDYYGPYKTKGEVVTALTAYVATL